MMFRDDSTPVNYTPIEVEATFLDSIAPSVDAAGDVGPVNSASTQNGSGSDSGSGIASYTWTASSADVTISSPSSAVSVFLGPDGTDAVYTITLTAADKAGNTASDSFSLDWDTEIPSPPTVTSSSSMTTDTTPTWTWTSSASSDAEDAYQRKLDSGNWFPHRLRASPRRLGALWTMENTFYTLGSMTMRGIFPRRILLPLW